MDAISYSHSVKQEKRIKNFISDPDSSSGLLTVPKVIVAGESVTVPAGRVAVLPNTQVDGEITVEAGAEIFVPAGSSVDFSNGIKVNGEKLTMSIPTAYHIYNGSVEATNAILTNGFSTTLYTGNGTAQSINTGVDMATQWGDDVSETYGGLAWVKCRNVANVHQLLDTVRGVTKRVSTNTTDAEYIDSANGASFNSNGFTIGANPGINTNLNTHVSWNFQTTHRISGVTNHGKPYTCHYNPYTGFTIVKYEGSGLAGHEIPHHLGRKLNIAHLKNLTSAQSWISSYNAFTTGGGGEANLNETGIMTYTPTRLKYNENFITQSTSDLYNNAVSNNYIVYGWANSYFDESNKLIGNYEIGVYQGTGATGNKVKTRGKPAWLMWKRLDSTGNWSIVDVVRSGTTVQDDALIPNQSVIEQVNDSGRSVTFMSDGFTVNTTNAEQNASGGQYLYMVVYDNDSGSGKSKYPKATDTTNLSINALVPYANGIDANGSKVSIENKNETITGLTLTQGKNYVYSKNDGTYGVSRYEPMYGSLRNRSVAGENPDYFDLKTMKWYGTSGGNELVTNGTFSDGTTTGWTAVSSTLSIVNNSIRVTSSVTNIYGHAIKEISTVIGKKYRVAFKIVAKSNTQAGVYIDSNSGVINSGNMVSTGISAGIGSYSLEFTAQTTTTYIKLAAENVSGYWAQFDDISVFEVEPIIDAEITPRTYLDCIVYADHNGQVSYVEELPKTTYFDEVKANEFKGKNACTALANIDGTTIPPTIKDGSINVSSVIKISTGVYDIYHNEDYNTNIRVGAVDCPRNGGIVNGTPVRCGNILSSFSTLNKTRICTYYIDVNGGYTLSDESDIKVTIFGGKN